MRSTTDTIIISSLHLGEADKLVTFFSLERGMLKGVAKNARKSFRRFGAGLESFTRSRLVLFEREHQELARIESADIVEQHAAIGRDLCRGAAGSVMLELVREMAPLGEQNAPAFLLLSQTLHLLDNGEEPFFLLTVFMIKFLSLLGYEPRLDQCVACGNRPRGAAAFLALRGGVLCGECSVSSGDETRLLLSPGAVGFCGQVLRMDMDKISRLKPAPGIVRELEIAFTAHSTSILGKRLKSTEFLRCVTPR